MEYRQNKLVWVAVGLSALALLFALTGFGRGQLSMLAMPWSSTNSTASSQRAPRMEAPQSQFTPSFREDGRRGQPNMPRASEQRPHGRERHGSGPFGWNPWALLFKWVALQWLVGLTLAGLGLAMLWRRRQVETTDPTPTRM